MSTETIAPVIPLFPSANPATTVRDYAQVATRLVAEARKKDMDPMILASAMVTVVAAEQVRSDESITRDTEQYGPEGSFGDRTTKTREFRGCRYVERRDVTDIAKDIRTDIKAARRSGELVLPTDAKVSVRINRYSLGRSIDVHVTGLSPEQLWVAPGTDPDYINNCPLNGGWSPYRKAATAVLNGILARDNSDTLTDYYDVEFSSNVSFAE